MQPLNNQDRENLLNGLNELQQIANNQIKNNFQDVALQISLRNHQMFNNKSIQLMDRLTQNLEVKKIGTNLENKVSNPFQSVNFNYILETEKARNLQPSVSVSEKIEEKEEKMGIFQYLGKNMDAHLDKEVLFKTVEFLKNNTNILYEVTSSLGATYLIVQLLKTFNESQYPQSDFNRLNIHSQAWKDLKAEQLRANKLIVLVGLTIFFVGKGYQWANRGITININDNTAAAVQAAQDAASQINSGSSNINPSVTESNLGILFIMKKLINNLPNWCKVIIFPVIWTIFTVLLKKYTGISIIQLYQNKIFILSLICFMITINFWALSYYAISLYLCIVYSNKTITIPSYLPKFISNWLERINRINQSEHKDIFIKVFIKSIILHLIISIFITFFLLLWPF